VRRPRSRPFCTVMLDDGVRRRKKPRRDVSTLLVESIDG
jgi:hypothetical protein